MEKVELVRLVRSDGKVNRVDVMYKSRLLTTYYPPYKLPEEVIDFIAEATDRSEEKEGDGWEVIYSNK